MWRVTEWKEEYKPLKLNEEKRKLTKKWFKHRTFSVHEEEGVGADTGTHQKKPLSDDKPYRFQPKTPQDFYIIYIF